ncbi:unnamed protein product [marine sediment metagenome]|uniref:Uncharacterized protein n=1 Tax=marine sediment metagenome TaxID=412755 RepID=X1KJH1_9ZZZZ
MIFGLIMSNESNEEIFPIFEEISNSFRRENQYFDILFDSISSVRIKKSLTEESISINAKKSGIVARTFIGSWKEYATQDVSELKNIEKRLPNVANKGKEINEFEAWKINKEIKPKINPSDIPNSGLIISLR